MTKTLTEQWHKGKLPDGYYYIDYDTQQRIFEIEDGCATYQGLPAESYFLNDVCLIKVLAPVPSYDEFVQQRDFVKDHQKVLIENMNLKLKIERLEKQLSIATKALKKYQEAINRFKKDPMNNIIMLAHQLIYDIDTDSKKALKEIEEYSNSLEIDGIKKEVK